jgi:beta-lactamase regulating signal transducer with metallopeptidase domain
MTASEMQVLAQLVAERALNSILGGLLIAAFAWLVLRVVGRQNSGTRFAVWFSALIAIAGLPFVPGFGPARSVPHVMRAEITLPGVWAIAICAVWIFFAALAATRVFFGFRNLRRLRKTAVALAPSSLHPALRGILAECEAIRPVTVCSSTNVKVPAAIGFFKPVILIPDWALRDLPVEELKIILLHEFAHLRRWDDWTNLGQKIVRTLFFFHPAVWWVEKKLSLEREMACDDAVLAETKNPRAYAECLVSLAEKSFVQRSLALAQAAISRARDTSIRLAQILDEDRPRATRVFKPVIALMTVLGAMCLVMLPEVPHLIAFESEVQPSNFAKVPNVNETLPPRTQDMVVPVSAHSNGEAVGATGVRQVASTPAVYRRSQSAGAGPDRREKPDRGNFARALGVPEGHHPSARPLPAAARQRPTGTEFLVVMQRTELDQQGLVVMNVSVWRVTFEIPHANTVQQRVVAKST